MRGGIGREIGPVRERLLSLLAALEAAIDFGDEDDVPEAKPEQICERVDEIVSKLEALLRSFEAGRRFRDGATVAIAGVANVGKSRLLNRLAGEERAIVDETPGTTRDYLQAEVSVEGIPVLLVDTAGLRRTEDRVERKGVLRSRDVISRADLVLFVLDGGRAVGEEDREAFREVMARPHLVVVNKIDLPPVAAGGGACRGEDGQGSRSRLREDGRGDRSARGGRCPGACPFGRRRPGAGTADPGAAPARVEKAVAALARAKSAAMEGLSPEFPAADVREASRALAELLGEVAPEEVLDEVFRRFCIGK